MQFRQVSPRLAPLRPPVVFAVAALLAGCLTDGTGGNAGGSRAPLPGSYYGKYAGSGIVREAELVLETNGTARFLQFQRNRPYAVTKAMWGTADSLLISRRKP
jgi:hypothetical protein